MARRVWVKRRLTLWERARTGPLFSWWNTTQYNKEQTWHNRVWRLLRSSTEEKAEASITRFREAAVDIRGSVEGPIVRIIRCLAAVDILVTHFLEAGISRCFLYFPSIRRSRMLACRVISQERGTIFRGLGRSMS